MHQGVVEHSIRGRMRLRYRQRRGDAAFFADLVELLSADPRIERTIADPRTGSLLVFHQGDASEIAERAGAARPRPAAVQVKDRPPRAFDPARFTPRPETLLWGALALVQLGRGRLLGSASEQFWHAGRAARFGRPGLAAILAGLGVARVLGGVLLQPASSYFMYALIGEASRRSPARSASLPRLRLARLRSAMGWPRRRQVR